LKNSFSELRGCAGKDWLNRPLNRHKIKISIRSATAEGFNRAALSGFFDIIEAELKKHKVPTESATSTKLDCQFFRAKSQKLLY
jgi:hypothetical protein